MKSKVVVPLIGIAFLVTACASYIAPAEKPAIAPRNDEKATVYVLDVIRGFRIGIGEYVVVNGVTLAPLSSRQYTWFYVEPGDMAISMNNPTTRDRKMSARQISVEKGKVYYLAYRHATYENNWVLLDDLWAGKKQGPEVRPEELISIPEDEALMKMRGMTLVGCREVEPNTAEPGATDNLGRAQRLREDD